MGRAGRTKTSKGAVKHTLKHARSPEGLVVGIEALGLHTMHNNGPANV